MTLSGWHRHPRDVGSALAGGAVPAAVFTAFAAFCMGLGALMASPLPLTGRVAFAGALIAPVCTFALWLRRPELLIGGYIFALPLLERRELVSGFEPAELATAVVVAVGALSVVTRRRARVPARFQLIFWTLVALAIVGAMAGLANDVLDREQVATSVFKPLSWVVVLYLVLLYFDSPRKLRGLLLAMILSGAAVAVIAVVQLATGNVPVSGDDVPRARGTFENYNDLGGFMALMAVPALTYALSTRRNSLKVLLLAAFVVQLAAVLLSGTLGSLLGLLVAGVLSLRIWKVRPAAGLAMVAFALVAAEKRKETRKTEVSKDKCKEEKGENKKEKTKGGDTRKENRDK